MPKFILYAYISLVNAERKIIEKEREKLQQEGDTVPGNEFTKHHSEQDFSGNPKIRKL